MNRIVALTTCLSILFAGCVPAVMNAEPARPAKILLRVISGADNATRVPGAEVFRVGSEGALTRVGVTDNFGQIRIDRSILPAEGSSIAVVVCHPMFFCGALRTDYVAPRDEMTLALAAAVTD